MPSGMTGADADELDRLAHEIDQLASRFAGARTDIDRTLRAAPWHGAGANRFRHQWSGEFARSLVAAEHFLDDAAKALRDNARQQRDASAGPGGGHGGRIPGTHPGSLLDRLIHILHLEKFIADRGKDALDMVIGVAKRNIVRVRAHTRGGTDVVEHVRWKGGTADDMRRMVGDAQDLEGISRNVDRFGHGLNVLDGGIHGLEQWNRDDERPLEDRLVRTGAVTAANVGIAYGSAAVGSYIGGAVGTLIPVPVVGTAVGVAVGFGVGYGVGWVGDKLHADEHIADAASWAVREGGPVARDVVEAGTDAVRAGRHVVDGGVNLAGKGLKALGGLF